MARTAATRGVVHRQLIGPQAPGVAINVRLHTSPGPPTPTPPTCTNTHPSPQLVTHSLQPSASAQHASLCNIYYTACTQGTPQQGQRRRQQQLLQQLASLPPGCQDLFPQVRVCSCHKLITAPPSPTTCAHTCAQSPHTPTYHQVSQPSSYQTT